jgi:outer membrane protein TolC
VDQAYGQVQTALAGIRMAEENVAFTTEDLRVTRERYRLGVATILDLQAAQIALRQAEVDLVSRRFDYRIGIARLEALLGRELQP